MSSSSDILLIQVGTPPDELRARLGDLPSWFVRALGDAVQGVQVVRVFEGEPLPEPGQHAAAIITGSWAMVTDRLDWSECTAQWIRRAMAIGMPLLGVCYGHQLMADALGGKVDYHPDGPEIGYLDVELLPAAKDDPLLSTLPAHFGAHLTHMQSVLEPPPGSTVLARSAHEAHQILRYGPNALSVQFHPEFVPEVMNAVIDYRAAFLRERGAVPARMIDQTRDAPEARGLMQRFVTQARQSQR